MNEQSVPSSPSKVYEETIRQIREIIKKDGLSAGDKIPSERELADRLQVGRSSVREALRALELLGIIETRRGEGTYIKDFGEHHLIKLLGMFILEESKAAADLIELHELVEKNAFLMVLNKGKQQELRVLKKELLEGKRSCKETVRALIELSDNHLIYRIWTVLRDYAGAVKPLPKYSFKACEGLLNGLLEGKEEAVLLAYHRFILEKIVD
ncbi:FadR/GntR family transcriptional regulator [Metabacillus sp. RGM 3146]|uniref:FadR/GntR family transcriptional regulator n=1 Tax=Metabacillus sp. RGM 3146 TaxID=3401092 RepID=UPI003B9D8CD6